MMNAMDFIPVLTLLEESRELLFPRQMSDVRWKHVLREANQLADILAKESLDLLAPCKIHDIVPPSISVALLADRRGILFPSGF